MIIIHLFFFYIYKKSDDGEDEVQQEQQQLLQADAAQRRIQIEALDNEIEYNETLISEREGEIQGIEQGITELNEIFRDLGMLVNEQESGIRKYYLFVLCIRFNLLVSVDLQRVFTVMFSIFHKTQSKLRTS